MFWFFARPAWVPLGHFAQAALGLSARVANRYVDPLDPLYLAHGLRVETGSGINHQDTLVHPRDIGELEERIRRRRNDLLGKKD